MSNAILTRPSAFPPPRDISSPFTFFSICGSPLSLSLFSSHSSICPPIYSSFPTAISSSEPLCIPPLHHSLTQPVFLSLVLLQPGLSVSTLVQPLPPCLPLFLPSDLSVMLSFTLSSSTICAMLGSVDVCV